MDNINKQIYITSMAKAIMSGKRSGNFDTRVLALYRLYTYYLEYTDGKPEFQEQNRKLKELLAKLKYAYPTMICSYKTVIGNVNTPNIAVNTPPTNGSGNIDILNNSYHHFTLGDFLISFADAQGDSYDKLRIYPLQSTDYGNLFVGPDYNDELLSPIEFDISNLSSTDTIELRYVRTVDVPFSSDHFFFKISDNNANSLFSLNSRLDMVSSLNTASTGNQEAIIGDGFELVDNRATTVFTLTDFTSDLVPPYNDPEGDLIDAIRIDDISLANQGVFYFNGLPIYNGLIITREDINASLFYHVGPDQDAISSDTFTFSARDEGSGIWVQ